MPRDLSDISQTFGDVIGTVYAWIWMVIVVMFVLCKGIMPMVELSQEEKERKKKAIKKEQEKQQKIETERKEKVGIISRGILKRSDYNDWLREQILKLDIDHSNANPDNQPVIEGMRTRLEKVSSLNSEEITKLSGDISSIVDTSYNIQLIEEEWQRIETELATAESKM